MEEDSIALRENKKEMVPTQRIMKSLLGKKNEKRWGKSASFKKCQQQEQEQQQQQQQQQEGREENKRERERKMGERER